MYSLIDVRAVVVVASDPRRSNEDMMLDEDEAIEGVIGMAEGWAYGAGGSSSLWKCEPRRVVMRLSIKEYSVYAV